MFKNYFKLAYRNLYKNKLSSIINISGLSIAIGCCMVVFALVDMEYHMDTFHENAKQIFQVQSVVSGHEHEQFLGESPVPLGPALEEDFPQVVRSVRVSRGSGTLRYRDKVFEESIRFVDASFLHMFTFPLKYGDKDALSDKNALILTEA